jgi:hypothetical protein
LLLKIVRNPLLLGLLLLLLAPACKIVGAREYNLRELHEEDGRHKRVAALMGEVEYAYRFGMGAVLRAINKPELVKDPEKVKDPLDSCVSNLVALSKFNPDNEGVAEIQIETFARIAAEDPWQISRQISLHQLGKAGERLKLADQAWLEPSPPFASPEDVRDALSVMLQSLARPREGITPPDLAQACAAMAALNLDLDGARRALPAAAVLMKREGSRSAKHKPLENLVLDLERRVVRLSLIRGASDSSPLVRATAVEASVRALGSERLAMEILRLGRGDEAEEVHLMILTLLRARGLPQTDFEAQPKLGQSQRDGQLALVYGIAVGHPADRVRISAMMTLGAVSGAGFLSLREEDWQAWWDARPATMAR